MSVSKALMGVVLFSLCGVAMADTTTSTATTSAPSDFKRVYTGLQGGLVLLSGSTDDSGVANWGDLTDVGGNVQGVLGIMFLRSFGMDFKVGYSRNGFSSQANSPANAYVSNTTFSLNAKYVFRANNVDAKTRPYIGIGYGSNDTNISSSDGSNDSLDEHGAGPIIFLGIEHSISDSVSVLAEYTAYGAYTINLFDVGYDLPQLNLFNLGVHYHF